MKVTLLHNSPISLLVQAIRTCYQSFDKSDSEWDHNDDGPFYILGEKDKSLIKRIIESQHTSTLEHCVLTFNLEGWSRLCLQELARHRLASYSVKSTRYTLSELKNEESFFPVRLNYDRANKYINLTKNDDIDVCSTISLELLRQKIVAGIPNDQVKYCLPECYKFDGIFTINLRSLRNFLELRTSKRAHFEIRELAFKIYEVLPEEFKFTVGDCVHDR